MASSRRTFDTDSITLRTVFAKNGNNTNIPALRVLTADGSGGTTWRLPSSFGTNPSFNQIVTTAGTYTADLSYNTFRMTAGEGIGMTAGAAGSNQLYLYAKAFNQVDVSGANTLKAYSNDTFTPSFKIAATGGLTLRSDPARNTLFVDGPLSQTISSAYYGFNRFLVVPTVSTINSNIPTTQGTFLAANSPSSLITFSGLGDVILSTIQSTNQVFFQVSSYTAAGYLALSGEAFGLNTKLLSTISSQYVTKSDFSTATQIVSTNTFSNTSSLTSTIYGISSYFVTQFNILTGLINARATIVQLNTESEKFTTAISSFSTNYINYTQYVSSSAGIINQVSSVLFISGVSTLYIFGGNFYNFSTGALLYDQSDVSTLSTSVGGRISTTSNYFVLQNQGNLFSTTSTTIGLGTLGYVSTSQLISSVEGLGTFGYISSPSLISTVQGLGTSGYISTPQLASTVAGLGTAGYFSTLFLNEALRSTSKGIFDYMGSYSYISTPSLTSTLQSTTQGLIETLGSLNYVSIASLNSTLQSTTQGLNNYFGSQGYVSTAGFNSALTSTVTGLGTLSYVSQSALNFGLVSTFSRIGNYGYISSPNLQSTVEGLGSAKYVSVASLVSTVSSLNFTVSTGLARPSFKSSIVYEGSNGNITALTCNLDMYFSTALFNLDAFSSFIEPTSGIFFDIHHVMYFPLAPGAGQFGTLSTSITCAETRVPGAEYSDAISYTFNNLSNTYFRTMSFKIPTEFAQAAYTSTYALGHYISSGIWNADDNPINGYNGPDLYVGTSPLNSMFVTILN